MNRFVTWLHNLFGIAEHEIEPILAGFKNTLARLEKHVDLHSAKADAHDIEAERLRYEAQKQDAMAEAVAVKANEADVVRAKIAALISP